MIHRSYVCLVRGVNIRSGTGKTVQLTITGRLPICMQRANVTKCHYSINVSSPRWVNDVRGVHDPATFRACESYRKRNADSET